MNYLDNKSFMSLIEASIDLRVKALLKDSETYGEAIKKAKSHRLGYKYGELGSVIDEEINKKIVEVSTNQSINSITKFNFAHLLEEIDNRLQKDDLKLHRKETSMNDINAQFQIEIKNANELKKLLDKAATLSKQLNDVLDEINETHLQFGLKPFPQKLYQEEVPKN
ncbi:hypothetical protein ACQV2R_05150 [Facklamia sp. P12937]|uniref:hypothetical protein n=1 Tax=Facklamia sp. P12937 TaxID=3421949 RepID=UPI003D176BBE